jgi:glyoxylase-like metal-dependent hydrolase (beta-lactamase superfamily II)
VNVDPPGIWPTGVENQPVAGLSKERPAAPLPAAPQWEAARGARAVLKQDISEVADGVFLVRGSQVNWYLVREGQAVTLVDSGYPADTDRVEASVRHIGARPEDIAAVLVTHAHTDHIGAANQLHNRYGTPMYLHPAEVAHAQRRYLEQISLRAVVVRCWRPRMLRWAGHAIAAGGTADVAAAHAQPWPTVAPDGALDLPGRPVPVFTPGHTSGHTAYLLPRAGAVVTGDALVTSHPTTATPYGPQLIASYFQHDEALARTSLDALAALPARLVLPGHGEPWEGDLARAVAAARE